MGRTIGGDSRGIRGYAGRLREVLGEVRGSG